MLRSGTSVGAHYREATRSRSTAEFTAKLNAGLMELEETLYWLELIEQSGFIVSKKLAQLKDETGQLTAIFVAMIKNAKS
jgi:four helix bundle protein